MRKYLLYISIVLIVITVGGYFYVNHLVKSKIENFLQEQLSSQVTVDYSDLKLNTFAGSITLSDIKLRIVNQTDTVTHTRATVDKLIISGFGYVDFLFDDQIEFDHIDINENNIVYFKNKFVTANKKDSIPQDPLATLNKSLLIKDLEVRNTSLTIYDSGKDSVLLRIPNASMSLQDIRTDQLIIKQRIPFTYEKVTITSDSVYIKLNPLEDLRLESFVMNEKDIQISGISLLPKYTKQEYSRIIESERDYTILKIPEIDVIGYDFGFNNTGLYANVEQINISSPAVTIYRDKLVRDNTDFKPMYSKVLRDLEMELLINHIHISQANLSYEEKLKQGHPAGSLRLSKLDVEMANVGNTQKEGVLTKVVANGFFQNSKLHVDWTFDVNDTDDRFRFSGSLGKLPASNINSFVTPNLNVGFEGELDEVYFDVSGSNHTSSTAMKMAYKDFKIDVMRKDGRRVNKFLSGIVNIFVSKNSAHKDDRYREGKGDADRNKQKSFFNFVWISILSGLIDTMT